MKCAIAMTEHKIKVICHQAIYHHTNLPMFNPNITPIDPSAIMYTYGSEDEFKAMIAEIESKVDVILFPPRGEDLGEKTVKEFIEGIVEAVLMEDEEECGE